MSTTIYGASDDLVEFNGDIDGEVSCYGTDDEDHNGVLVICSDATILKVKYGKRDLGIWGIELLRSGELFDGISQCEDEDEEGHTDVAVFKDGLKWAYTATGEWEKVS